MVQLDAIDWVLNKLRKQLLELQHYQDEDPSIEYSDYAETGDSGVENMKIIENEEIDNVG